MLAPAEDFLFEHRDQDGPNKLSERGKLVLEAFVKLKQWLESMAKVKPEEKFEPQDKRFCDLQRKVPADIPDGLGEYISDAGVVRRGKEKGKGKKKRKKSTQRRE
jgi:hypothetical protein